MQFALLSILAFTAGSLAQTKNLTSLLTSTPELSNFTSYMNRFPQLVSQLNSAQNITILAPSNDAFNHLLNGPEGPAFKSANNHTIEDILRYHVLHGVYPTSAVNSTPAFIPTMLTDPSLTNVTGGQVVEAITMNNHVDFISGGMKASVVTKANLNFTGGVVQIIDRVLTVPANISTSALKANLTAFAGALVKANMVQALDTMKDVTVFAPNNAAFKAIGSNASSLTPTQLAAILKYHVVKGKICYSTDLKNGQKLKALDGNELSVTVEGNGDIFINSAKVVVPNALVANGVAHVIDNVLNPSNPSATPNPSVSTQPPAFSTASSASSVPFTSLVTGTPTGIPTASPTTTHTSTGAAAPMRTGAVGAAAVFGACVALLNI